MKTEDKQRLIIEALLNKNYKKGVSDEEQQIDALLFLCHKQEIEIQKLKREQDKEEMLSSYKSDHEFGLTNDLILPIFKLVRKESVEAITKLFKSFVAEKSEVLKRKDDKYEDENKAESKALDDFIGTLSYLLDELGGNSEKLYKEIQASLEKDKGE